MSVDENWTLIKATWDVRGPEYYVRLFEKYPDAKDLFPAFVGLDDAGVVSSCTPQVENFRKGMESLINNLANTDALNAAIGRLAARHKERKMKPEYFKKAFDVFIEFNSEVRGFDVDAWTTILDDVYQNIASKMT